jgi:hypothetical protein
MGDIDEKVAREVCEHAYTIFKALKAQTEYITENAIATSALLQAVSEKHPSIAGRYEDLRYSMTKTAPVAVRSRQIVAQFDAILERLEKLKS